MGHDGGRDEHLPVKIGEEEFGTKFSAIEADDAEPVGSDLLQVRNSDLGT